MYRVFGTKWVEKTNIIMKLGLPDCTGLPHVSGAFLETQIVVFDGFGGYWDMGHGESRPCEAWPKILVYIYIYIYVCIYSVFQKGLGAHKSTAARNNTKFAAEVKDIY